MNLILKKSSGFSLIEVLVALGIMGVASTIIINLIASMNVESRALTEKMGALTLQGDLNRVVNNPALCSQLISNMGTQTFDSSQPTSTITLNQIKMTSTGPTIAKVSEKATPLSNSLYVDKITIKDFVNTGVPDTFKAQLIIDFDQTKLVRLFTPVSVTLFLKTTGAGNVKTLSTCASSQSTLNFQNCYTLDVVVPKHTSETRTCNTGFRLVFATALVDGSQDSVNKFSFTNDSITVNADDDTWRMLGKCCSEQ